MTLALVSTLPLPVNGERAPPGTHLHAVFLASAIGRAHASMKESMRAVTAAGSGDTNAYVHAENARHHAVHGRALLYTAIKMCYPPLRTPRPVHLPRLGTFPRWMSPEQCGVYATNVAASLVRAVEDAVGGPLPAIPPYGTDFDVAPYEESTMSAMAAAPSLVTSPSK